MRIPYVFGRAARARHTITRALTVLAAVVAAASIGAPAAGAATLPYQVHPAATRAPTSQLVFDDYECLESNLQLCANSIQIVGYNQNDVGKDACFTTPLTINLISGWWWAENTHIYAFTSSNCASGTRFPGAGYILNDEPTYPPYHCQEDAYPWDDWDPGDIWQACAVPVGSGFGYAIGRFVRNM